ncbi:MAG: phage tail assembly chaperone family protein, TAC [Pseudomonadota bacterium]
MTLEELIERGGFVPPELIEKEVTWKGAKGGPATFTVFIKPPTAATYDRSARAMQSSGDTLDNGYAPRPLTISGMLFFDKEGTKGISYVKACELHEGLCSVLYKACTEVIVEGVEASKNSQPPMSSGMSSSSTESVAGQ